MQHSRSTARFHLAVNSFILFFSLSLPSVYIYTPIEIRCRKKGRAISRAVEHRLALNKTNEAHPERGAAAQKHLQARRRRLLKKGRGADPSQTDCAASLFGWWQSGITRRQKRCCCCWLSIDTRQQHYTLSLSLSLYVAPHCKVHHHHTHATVSFHLSGRFARSVGKCDASLPISYIASSR